MANQFSIIPVNWLPGKGGIQSDLDPRSIMTGGLYCPLPETGGMNIPVNGFIRWRNPRSLTNSANVHASRFR